MIHLVVKENFILKKLISRRQEGFLLNNNGFYIKEFKDYTFDLITSFAKRYYTGTWRYVFYECGGEDQEKKNSYVQMVCSPNGEKLKPIKINRKYVDMEYPHAIFSGTDLCVIKMFYKGNHTKFTITRYIIDARTGQYVENLLYTEFYEHIYKKLPDEIAMFQDVLSAGSRKLKEYRCNKPYYYINF